MIVLEPICAAHLIACPHCGATICEVSSDEWRFSNSTPWLLDGDTPAVYHKLAPAQKAGISFENRLSVGKWSCCNRQYIVVTACLVAGLADENFRDVYFRANSGEPGPATNYLARRDKQPWCLSRFESAQGPVFEHNFGPLAWEDESWIRETGVARCTDETGSPWEFSERLLLTLWDDLRALTLAHHADR